MKKIKLKDVLLKETLTWNNRKFGDRLPNLADYKEAYDKKNGKKINEYKSGDDLAAMETYIFDAVNDLNNEIKKHPEAKKNSKIKNLMKQLYKIEAELGNEMQELD